MALISILVSFLLCSLCQSADDCKDPLCKPIHGLLCGTDGITYKDTCNLEIAACRSKGLVQLAYQGACKDSAHGPTNHCSLGTHNCNNQATCSNKTSGYSCQCKAGWTGNGIVCTDIDECANNNGGCHQALGICTNSPGSFTCACKPGYHGNGIQCRKRNQCVDGTHTCNSQAVCTNNAAGYTCMCKNGFTGNGVSCVDINECVLNNGGCHPTLGTCMNTHGSFSCKCKFGYAGDGKTCSVPTWFARDTKLCYQWYPDGNSDQCGGAGVGRKLCTRGMDTYTTYYRDDTDNRGGGCRMSWGIEAPSAPWWFKYTQLCYRWYPDGDGGQCGGGVSRLLCASVGKYTQYYRDDTDGRGGGCRMSWTVRVSWFAPAWMRKIRLCFNWYLDDRGYGQCGGGAQPLLCAVAGHWTSYYRDDTDNRRGGCRMRWGLFYS